MHPFRNCLNSLFPSEKSQFFSEPLGNIQKIKGADAATPPEMTIKGPSENLFHRGGVDIKWNGPLKKASMSSNKDFLPSSSPMSSICAIEIEAILFLFMMNCYKSSFQECFTIIVLIIERTRNQPPYCLHQLQEKIAFRLFPGRVVLGHPTPPPPPPPPPPRVCTGGRTYADVRTKIFRINGLPNLLTHGAPRAPLLHPLY